MTNVSATPEKVELRRRLFGLGEKALEQDGWRIERVPGSGKSSVRRIIRNGESHVVSIRTSQDTWIAFPRSADGNGWVTLDDVDTVIAVTVDDREAPKWAAAYMVSAEEMRQRFDRAYHARKDAGHPPCGAWHLGFDVLAGGSRGRGHNRRRDCCRERADAEGQALGR